MRTSNRQMQGGSSGMHPERRTVLESIRVDVLPPHPLSVRIYGKPKPTEELLRSIAEVGLLQPLVVNDFGDGSFQLLVGNTRAEAWRILLRQKKVTTVWIACRFVNLSPLEAERLVIESNRQRVKTAEQKAREFKELKRIEAALAKVRQSEAGKNKGKANLPEDSKGQSRDKAAAAVELKPRTAEKLEKLVNAKDAGSAEAAAALVKIDAKKGRGVDSAFRDVFQPTPKPAKDSEQVQAQKNAAQGLQALLKASGINADVARSKSEGKFHVTLHDVTAEQVREFSETFSRVKVAS